MPYKSKESPSKALIPVNRNATLATERTIVLEGDDSAGLFQREVRGVVLTGHVRGVRTASECNIVEAVLTSFTMQSSTLTSCDIKDSAIRESHFVDCTFGSSSITHNAISVSLFEECSFRYTDIQHCDFIQTDFVRCDLRNLLIKNCTFSRCTFRACHTSNKLLEMCRLSDCVFEDTDLQIETLAENFGITDSGFHGQLRDRLADGPHKFIPIEELPYWLRSAPAHPLNKLSVDYFLKETLLGGSPYLDAALNIQSWIPMFKTAGSFVVVLTQLVDFLIWLYDQEKVTIHALICFHSMTDALLGILGDEPPHRQALVGIGGVHLSLARVVDPYLVLLEELTCSDGAEARLLVEGPGTKPYYRRALAPFFARGDLTIKDLKPHNSPWELAVGFGAIGSKLLFLALFLATRTKIELSRIIQAHASESASSTPTVARRSPTKPAKNMTEPILSLDFGGSRVARVPPNLRLRAYLPGNLVAELQLSLASQRIAKLRKILKELL